MNTKTFYLGLLFLAALFAFFNSPFFRLEEVHIEGLERMDEEDVLRHLGERREDINILQINLGEIATEISRERWVREVRISRIFPGGLRISIREHQPAFYIRHHGGFFVVSSSGRILEETEHMGAYNLPLVSGVVEGVRDEYVELGDLGEAIRALDRLEREFRGRISELTHDGERGFVLYTRAGTPVLLGDEENLPRALPILSSVLEEVEARGMEPDYIDIRQAERPVISGN